MRLAAANCMRQSSYSWREIGRDESLMLRALAILMILLHNYLHWVSDTPGENEFTFRIVRVHEFINGLWDTPQDFVRLCASYLGHYGVQVFFFLSGYGLVRKYGGRIPSWWVFQKRRWVALYPAVFVSAIGYLVYEGGRLGFGFVFQTQGLNLLRQMVGISNFSPDNVYHPIGPWWFIGVIVQFYLLVPFVFKLVNTYGDRLLYLIGALSLLAEFFLGPLLESWVDVNINHTIIGHLDVCLMGIWFARRDKVSVAWLVIFSALVAFVMGSFYYSLWLVSGLMVMLFLLPVMRSICSVIKRHRGLSMVCIFLGNLSLYLFLCNGYLRKPLIEIAVAEPHWWTSIWSSLVFLGIVIVWAMILRCLEEKTRQYFRILIYWSRYGRTDPTRRKR